ncbi:MAG TPA: HAMP domain-containing protein [Candidatus Limnocylindria bacterium]|nr:HAMP domain-containing protein [Candidatus Limnocylindria bacterium]
MPQETVTMDNSKLAKPVNINWQRGGLKWKISLAFSGLIMVLGLMVIGIVYHFTGNALQRQVDLRSAAIGANLADAAAGMISRKSALELDALVAKYGRLDGVAYALVQDSKGEILASSMQPFPAELKESVNNAAPARVTSVRGKSVFETRVSVLDGQLGAVRVGLWAETLRDDMRATLLPIVGLIVACLALGIGLSVMLASRTIRPILELKSIADDISRGRLDTSVSIQTNDEVGELGRSLERMRASLKAAMVRLNRE